MNIAVAIYQVPQPQRKEAIEAILSVEDNNFSQEEKNILNYLSSCQEVDFGEMLIALRKGSLLFFEELNKRDAEDYIAHLKKTGAAKYIPIFQRFLK